MFALGSYAPAHARLIALTWGAEDLSAALGATDNKEPDGAWTFPYQLARAQCLIAASAAGSRGNRHAVRGLSRFGGARAGLPALAARRLHRAPGDPSRSDRRDQSLLRAVSSRDRARAQDRRGVRGQSRRRDVGNRRQDGRHSASEGGAKNLGVDVKASRTEDEGCEAADNIRCEINRLTFCSCYVLFRDGAVERGCCALECAESEVNGNASALKTAHRLR